MQPSSPRRSARVRVVASAGLSLLVITLLGACDAENTATRQGPATVTAVATTSESVAPITTTLPPITITDTVDSAVGASRTTNDTTSTDCAPDIGSFAAARRDEGRVRRPTQLETSRWTPYASGGTWCPGLSWVQVEILAPMPLPVRPRQLLIYHDGHFLGTGMYCSNWHPQDVVSTTRDSITVSYHWVDTSIPEQQLKQDALGRRTITYRWNGSRIQMDGTPPPRMKFEYC